MGAPSTREDRLPISACLCGQRALSVLLAFSASNMQLSLHVSSETGQLSLLLTATKGSRAIKTGYLCCVSVAISVRWWKAQNETQKTKSEIVGLGADLRLHPPPQKRIAIDCNE